MPHSPHSNPTSFPSRNIPKAQGLVSLRSRALPKSPPPKLPHLTPAASVWVSRSGGGARRARCPAHLCLYLIYKYRDVYMMALALSVFADAVSLAIAALKTDTPAQLPPSCGFSCPCHLRLPAGQGWRWECKKLYHLNRVGSFFP